MVLQPKKNGKISRTVDLSDLGRAGRHKSHHTRSAAEIAKSAHAGKLNYTLYCINGCHGMELAGEDCYNTTSGRKLVKRKRLPLNKI